MKRVIVVAISAVVLACSGFFLYDYSTMWKTTPTPAEVIKPDEKPPAPSPGNKTVVVEVPKGTPKEDVVVEECDPTLTTLETFC